MITAKSSKIELIKHYGHLTISQVVEHNYTPISVLKHELTDSKLRKIMGVMVLDACASHNATLNTFALEEITVRLVSTKLAGLSLEAVYVAMNRFIEEEVYGEVTAAKIIHCLERYRKKHQGLVMERNYNKHLSTKFTDTERSSEQRVGDTYSLSIVKSQRLLAKLRKKIKK